MGLLDFLFMSLVMTNSSNRKNCSSSQCSHSRTSSYDAGYDDGCEDSCIEHDCDSFGRSCDCDCEYHNW